MCSVHTDISVPREQFVLAGERCTNWHSLSILIPINTLIISFKGHEKGWNYVSFTCHSHVYAIKGINTNTQRHFEIHRTKVRKTWVWCVYFITSSWLGLNKRPCFCHTILLAGYFWCSGGGEGWKNGHKGKNVVPVVVLGGHGRVNVGVGCLPFDIGWPLGCMTQGLLREDGWRVGKMGV